MKKITDVIVEAESNEEYVVHGEGCTNDCQLSWQSEAMGCKKTSWITDKL